MVTCCPRMKEIRFVKEISHECFDIVIYKDLVIILDAQEIKECKDIISFYNGVSMVRSFFSVLMIKNVGH